MSIFYGAIIHSERLEEVTIFERAAIVVINGKVNELKDAPSESDIQTLKKKYNVGNVISLKDGQFLIPGLIDTHTHAPQFPNAGIGYDKPLLDWLQAYTFPLEDRYKDPQFAQRVYTEVVKRTMACGSTTVVYFGSVHLESSVTLARIMASLGQRGLVGKVNMDLNCPSSLIEETAVSLQQTEQFISAVHNLKSSLVKPVVTPRFAVTCSQPLLSKLGDIARKDNLHIQTHLCENKKEIEVVLDLFPGASMYTEVYDRNKLLTRKTILAHCVHLTSTEVALIKARGSTVSHCPNSNISLQSGLCDVRELMRHQINVSLGSDVAGGSNPCILDAIRCALNTSVIFSLSKPDYKPLSYHEAFFMATMGGAIALDMEDKLGNFCVGKYFDAIIVDTKVSDSPVEVLTKLTPSELFQKFIYTGDDRNIVQVYVDGKNVLKK